MKVFTRRLISRLWRSITLLLSGIGLLACTEYIDIYRPLDITRAGQSVAVEFEIKKQGGINLFCCLRQRRDLMKWKGVLSYSAALIRAG